MTRTRSWDRKRFLKDLESAGPRQRVGATFFVREKRTPAQLTQLAKRLARECEAGAGLEPPQVSPLANAFSLRGTPAALAKLAAAPEIASALRDEQEDILPRPRNFRPIDPNELDSAFVQLEPDKPAAATAPAKSRKSRRRG